MGKITQKGWIRSKTSVGNRCQTKLWAPNPSLLNSKTAERNASFMRTFCSRDEKHFPSDTNYVYLSQKALMSLPAIYNNHGLCQGKPWPTGLHSGRLWVGYFEPTIHQLPPPPPKDASTWYITVNGSVKPKLLFRLRLREPAPAPVTAKKKPWTDVLLGNRVQFW